VVLHPLKIPKATRPSFVLPSIDNIKFLYASSLLSLAFFASFHKSLLISRTSVYFGTFSMPFRISLQAFLLPLAKNFFYQIGHSFLVHLKGITLIVVYLSALLLIFVSGSCLVF
jgi:hypothetical protein